MHKGSIPYSCTNEYGEDMLESVILGLIGGLLLIVTSRMGIILSRNVGTQEGKHSGQKAISVIMVMITLQFVLIGTYVPLVLMAKVVLEAPFVLSLGLGIFLDVAYKVYLALTTNIPTKPRPHWIGKVKK